MSVEEGYRERYCSGNTPWDVGKPDFNLIDVVADWPVAPCKCLDMGCGTGDNSVWLAQNGFAVTATDTSPEALDLAREKAAQSGVECVFLHLNFLESRVEGGPFGFAFDRGCFHSFGDEELRERFARNVAGHLEQGGLWLTLAGNADERRRGPGPPQLTAARIVNAVEPFFEVLLLESTRFGSSRPDPPRAWKCLMKKR